MKLCVGSVLYSGHAIPLQQEIHYCSVEWQIPLTTITVVDHISVRMRKQLCWQPPPPCQMTPLTSCRAVIHLGCQPLILCSVALCHVLINWMLTISCACFPPYNILFPSLNTSPKHFHPSKHDLSVSVSSTSFFPSTSNIIFLLRAILSYSWNQQFQLYSSL